MNFFSHHLHCLEVPQLHLLAYSFPLNAPGASGRQTAFLRNYRFVQAIIKINFAQRAVNRALSTAAAPLGSARVMLCRLNDKGVLTQLVIMSQRQAFLVSDS